MAKKQTSKRPQHVLVAFEVKRAIEDTADLRMEAVDLSHHLTRKLNLSDTQVIEILELLEYRFKIEFTDSDDLKIESVQDIVDIMKEKLEQKKQQDDNQLFIS